MTGRAWHVAAFFCVLNGAGLLHAKSTEPVAILFPDPIPGRQPYRVEWIALPDDAEFQRILPPTATTNGRVEWDCTLRRDGRLTRCKAQTEWPAGQGFAAAIRPLLTQYVVAPHVAADARRTKAHVIFGTEAWRPGLPSPDLRSCPPIFCTSIPPPPPPPRPR